MVQGELGDMEEGFYGSAVETYRKLIVLDEKADGPNTSLAAMSNCAGILNKWKKYADAEIILKRLLPLLRESPKLSKDSAQVLGASRMLQ